MTFSADIDIDLKTEFIPAALFPWVRASRVKDDKLFPHPCGVYPQNIPVDLITGLSAIPFKEAEDLGYSKIDFLHLGLYDYFNTREEIEELLEVEPDWGLLTLPQEQVKLFQLSKHGDILSLIKPKNIEELADVLALIRPGKKQFAKLYQSQKEATRRILYAKDETGYSFKKSHAIAYSLVIVLQLHLIGANVI
jgi:DNA polymerase III alpha subunit